MLYLIIIIIIIFSLMAIIVIKTSVLHEAMLLRVEPQRVNLRPAEYADIYVEAMFLLSYSSLTIFFSLLFFFVLLYFLFIFLIF